MIVVRFFICHTIVTLGIVGTEFPGGCLVRGYFSAGFPDKIFMPFHRSIAFNTLFKVVLGCVATENPQLAYRLFEWRRTCT
jgi:hypothetical protein